MPRWPFTAEQRFEHMVERGEGDGCDIWIGGKRGGRLTHGQEVYGAFWFKGKTYRAHRWVMEQLIGRKLRRDEQVLHRCNNPMCVKITHLSIGSQSDNMRQMTDEGRNPTQFRRRDDGVDAQALPKNS